MRHENFVVFHNDSDSSYMNSADNFRGAEIGAATKIDIYFESAGSVMNGGSYDRVRLTVGTAGDEEKALEAIAGAMQGNKSGLTVIADDKNSKYFSDFFTGVDSFTTASQSMFTVTEDVAAGKVLTAGDSGKIFMINQASAYNITLPNATDAGAGWNARFIVGTVGAYNVAVIATDSDGDNIHVRGFDLENAAQTAGTGNDVINFINGAIKGDEMTITCDGTSYYAISFANEKAHITVG